MKNFVFEKTKIEYTKMPADIDESVCDHLGVKERVVELSYLKCKKIADQYDDAIVISADTISTDGEGTPLNKPKDLEESFVRGLSLSGKLTSVYTGCTVYVPEKGYQKHLAQTEIKYMKFNEATLRKLVDGDDPLIRNSLGLYSDTPGFTLVESWNGSYTGALGLPMEFVYDVLSSLE